MVTGKVVPDEDRQIRIFPQVSGTVTAVHVHSGYYVKAGQVLAELKSTEMANFNNELAGAEANLANARRDLSAKEDMFNGGLVSFYRIHIFYYTIWH
ncbi:MAG: biotin/lipoyl-binding protein [Chitinophagaceae bacterium]|nr:MAG: biotin/lipoyl-binding protein [Chitinophagaceae bacterium]